jgi:acetylornithine/succinyldiaminopimelate/putrescine aminotransferase
MPSSFLAETYERMLREQLPNLFRLYVNAFVAQTCLCLSRYVALWHSQETVPQRGETVLQRGGGEYQSFLANSFDEALSGAIKLARYDASVAGRPTLGLVLDPAGRLGPFASAPAGGGRVEFVPGLVVVGGEDDVRKVASAEQRFGFVVLVAADGTLDRHAEAVREVLRRDAALLITCVDRASLAGLRRTPAGLLRELAPDVVVFDESFANRDVPFGAFTAKKALYDRWNRPGKTTFHSTTFQPNTISSLHFMRCLERDDPEFIASLAPELRRVEADLKYRGELYRRLYSPSLYKAARLTGCDTADVRAAGGFVYVDGRAIFDGVSGVACSVRGHNPPGYAEELAAPGAGLPEVEAEVAARLRDLTGLGNVLPAVSGASAVESALKLALVAQHPRRYVLALKSGFGGKTLFALTGTWNASYKAHIDPLYGDVLYVDPFAPDATTQLEAALEKYPVAVVQVELVQGVGGVRRVPDEVLRFLEAGRQRWGYLLLVDEVQTGMYRTGAFARSQALGLTPDLLVVGKGVSDMMFPYALLLYSDAVRARLEHAGSDLPAGLRQRYGYEFGYRTVLNVLRRAEELRLAERVAESGALAARLLGDELADCPAVREVRVFGLLLGIELDAARWPRRWFRKRLFWFYLFNMLRHPRFPVLVGFCQYEPNVLKITPPLNATPEELRRMCATVAEVLRRPFYQLAAGVVGGMVRSVGFWRRKKHEHAHVAAHEPGVD